MSSIKESSSFLNAVLPNNPKSGMAPILIFGSLLSAQRFHQDSVNISIMYQKMIKYLKS